MPRRNLGIARCRSPSILLANSPSRSHVPVSRLQSVFIFVDLSDDLIDGCDPLNGLRLPVVVPNVLFDGLDQLSNAPERATTDALARDFDKPALNLVEPGRTGRSEVNLIPWPGHQPLLYFRVVCVSRSYRESNGCLRSDRPLHRSVPGRARTPDGDGAAGSPRLRFPPVCSKRQIGWLCHGA